MLNILNEYNYFTRKLAENYYTKTIESRNSWRDIRIRLVDFSKEDHKL